MGDLENMEEKNNLKKATPLLLDEFVPFLFNRITNLLALDSRDELHRLDLTVPRWRVLATLVSNDGLSIGQIAINTVMDHASTSRVVKQMEEQGLIYRQMDKKDSRYTFVHLTQQGHDVFNNVRPKAIEQQKFIFDNLTEEERESLLGVLHKIIATIDPQKYKR